VTVVARFLRDGFFVASRFKVSWHLVESGAAAWTPYLSMPNYRKASGQAASLVWLAKFNDQQVLRGMIVFAFLEAYSVRST
jgi:hypothetical protein